MRIRARRGARVRLFPTAEVTVASDREVDPRSVGLEPGDIEAIWSAAEALYETGLHPAIGLCIRRRGEVILDRTIGHVRGNAPTDPEDAERVLASPDSRFSFFSGSKAVTAVLVHILADRGLLHVDEPVANFIPEFARKGKDRITIRQLLSHEAGIPGSPADMLELSMLREPGRILELIYELEPRFEPGEAPAYHTLNSGFILAELIERVSGMGIRELLSKEIRDPLEMQSFNYGVPEEELDTVAVAALTGPEPRWPIESMFRKALGASPQELVDLINDSRFRTAIVPSANIIATPDELSRFFDMLLRGGSFAGRRIMSPSTVARAIEPQSPGRFDRVIKVPMAYSMGFMLGHDPVGFYGPRCGRAFGHIGLMNIVAWADPERDVAVALTNTGKPMPSFDPLYRAFNIMREISRRIPRDGRGPLSQP